MASAWIRWRKNRDGIKLATLQWRDAEEHIHSEALGTSDERVARVYLDAKRRDLGKPRRRSRSASQSLREALEGYLAEKGMTCRPATVGQYKQRLGWLFDAWAGIRQSKWDRALYVAFLEGRKWSPRSRQLQTAICRQFIEWAHEAGFPIPDFVGGYKSPRVYLKKPTTLTAEQVDRLLKAAEGSEIEPAVVLAALGGLRHGEVRAARWEDVDWDDGMLTIQGTKTHRDRVIPMSTRLREVLWRHRGARQRIVRSTCTVKSLKALCRRAGVPEVSWHPLRHTCGSQLARSGVPATTIRDWLGHASIATTNIYMHTNREDMRKAADALG